MPTGWSAQTRRIIKCASLRALRDSTPASVATSFVETPEWDFDWEWIKSLTLEIRALLVGDVLRRVSWLAYRVAALSARLIAWFSGSATMLHKAIDNVKCVKTKTKGDSIQDLHLLAFSLLLTD